MTQPCSPVTDGSNLRRRWRSADHDGRRQLIGEAGLRLLHEQGLEAVTMRRVAARLGVGAMTLYTYVDGQRELQREMVRQGFDLLSQRCRESSTLHLEHAQSWRGGAKAYLDFAVGHPNLYRLMFDVPMNDDLDLLHGGFKPLRDRVRQRLAQRGLQGAELDRETRASAGRYWIALHGLATLAISGRLSVLEGDLDDLLDDLLPRVAPQ